MKGVFTAASALLRRYCNTNMWGCLLCIMAVGWSVAAQADDFARANPGYLWDFPRDHGSHPLYQTEWWYYTGQLYAQGKQPFHHTPEYGFQLTFFRRSSRTGDTIQSEYLAHATLIDLAGQRTYFSSRLGGGALGLAKTASDSLAARSGDWTVDPIGGQLVLRFSIAGTPLDNHKGRDRPPAAESKALELRILTAALPEVWLQGKNGFSAKSLCDGCASMYYSLPRVSLQARLVVGGSNRELHGLAWIDHEFMTNSLGSAQVGWDWFGLMLKDGRSVMLFQLRNSAGSVDFASGGVRRDQSVRTLSKGDFSVTPIRTWRSPSSGAEYPIEWRVSIPSEGIDTVLQARFAGCEVGDAPTSSSADVGSVRYWEGPVASCDESVTGYLEMTGYAGKVAM